MREQFEKLPDIARIVSSKEIKWCNAYNWYGTDNTDANSIYHVAYLNGAWYAFREQQKKIDSLEKLIDRIYSANEDSEIKSIIDGWSF